MTTRTVYIYKDGVVVRPVRFIRKTINFIRVYRFFNQTMYNIAMHKEN